MKYPIKVGAFTIDDDGALTGPAEYMREQGDAHLARILAGEDVCSNAGLSYSPNAETALLVSMQTDYAAWKGLKGLRQLTEHHITKGHHDG